MHDQLELEDAIGRKGNINNSKFILKTARVTERGISFVKLFAATAHLPNNTKTSEDPSDLLFQVLLSICTDTIKDVFYHIVGNIG